MGSSKVAPRCPAAVAHHADEATPHTTTHRMPTTLPRHVADSIPGPSLPGMGRDLCNPEGLGGQGQVTAIRPAGDLSFSRAPPKKKGCDARPAFFVGAQCLPPV